MFNKKFNLVLPRCETALKRAYSTAGNQAKLYIFLSLKGQGTVWYMDYSSMSGN